MHYEARPSSHDSSIVDLWFEQGAVCVTPTTVSTPTRPSPSATASASTHPGRGTQSHPGLRHAHQRAGQTGGQLQGVPIKAPYWVVKLVPSRSGTSSCTSTPSSRTTCPPRSSCWPGTRPRSARTTKARCWTSWDKNGFTKIYNKPRETLQSAQCQYNPPPSHALSACWGHERFEGCCSQKGLSQNTEGSGPVCLLVGCLTSQQHASVSQGRICSDNLRAATLR